MSSFTPDLAESFEGGLAVSFPDAGFAASLVDAIPVSLLASFLVAVSFPPFAVFPASLAESLLFSESFELSLEGSYPFV